MVMALDCGGGGPEFKPRRFQNIFDVRESALQGAAQSRQLCGWRAAMATVEDSQVLLKVATLQFCSSLYAARCCS